MCWGGGGGGGGGGLPLPQSRLQLSPELVSHAPTSLRCSDFDLTPGAPVLIFRTINTLRA